MNNFRLVVLAGKAINIVEAPESAKLHVAKTATVTVYATLTEAQAAIATLKLVPYITAADKLAALFGELSTADQQTYQLLFAPIAALVNAGHTKAAAVALGAVPVPDALKPKLAAMIKLLQ
jgi:hypothetical protein